jgi:hypothetical protein
MHHTLTPIAFLTHIGRLKLAWLLLLFLVIGLSGCVSFLHGELKDNRYISHSGEFSVAVPTFRDPKYRDIKTQDGLFEENNLEVVGFAVRGRWWAFGYCFVEWHRLEPGVNAITYIAQLEKEFSEYSRKHYRGLMNAPTNLAITAASSRRIGEREVRQWIVQGQYDGKQAVAAMHLYNFDDRVGLVGIIFPADLKVTVDRITTQKDGIPWDFYLPFAESLRRLK